MAKTKKPAQKKGGVKKAASKKVAKRAPKKKSIWRRFRSAITGLFVTKKHAEANPNTTVRERVKP